MHHGEVPNYQLFYRLGVRPWERYPAVQHEDIAARLDRESAGRGSAPGRVLDVGCGRGVYAPALVARGWEYVGVDAVPLAVEQARAAAPEGATFRSADATALPDSLGTFDLFLDVGCFQGLDRAGREAEADGLTRLARPGATLLLLAFQPVRLLWFTGGVTPEQVRESFPGWTPAGVDPAPTAGLGWPLTLTRPTWYRFSRPDQA